MKAYNVYWSAGDKGSTATGGTIVVANSITKAIARFQDTYRPSKRVISSIYLECDEVLIDGVKDQ